MLTKVVLTAGMAVLGMAAPAQAATFTVSIEADSGPGSLRQAVADANATEGRDTIEVVAPAQFIRLRSTIVITSDVEISGAGRSQQPAVIRAHDVPTVRLLDVTAAGALTLTFMRLESGKAEGDGALVRSAGPLTITGGFLRYGSATGDGGAVASSGPLVVRDTLLLDNTAASGGAIAATGSATIERSALLDNVATGNAAGTTGAVLVGGTVTILRSSIGRNSIDLDGQSTSVVGAVKAAGGTIGETTFRDNEGTQIDFGGTITSSIVAGPTACSAAASSGGGNVFTDASCIDGGAGPRDLVGDPMLEPILANATNRTVVYAIKPGSPAIDRAVAVAEPKIDQRSFPRLDHPEFADVAGTDGTDAGAFELRDIVAPVVTVSGPATTNDTTPTFTFTTSEPAATTCQVTGRPAEPCTSPWTAPELVEGGYTVVVRAQDQTGNRGQKALSFRVAVPPVLAFEVPALTNDPRPVLRVSVSEPADVQCALDGVVLPCGDRPAAALADGRHVLQATATDDEGDTAEGEAAFVVDTRAPETTAVREGRGWRVGADEAGSTIACTLDGAPIACDAQVDLPPGAHRFTAVATDPAGNADASPAVSEVVVPAPQGGTQGAAVDRLAPNTRILTKLRRTRSRRPVVRFTATERGATFECRVDTGRWRACRSGRRIAVRPGRRVLLVRARDAAGNTDATPARLVFRVLRRR